MICLFFRVSLPFKGGHSTSKACLHDVCLCVRYAAFLGHKAEVDLHSRKLNQTVN